MKMKVAALQIGTFSPEDSYESYLEKQVALLERAVGEEHPYLVVFPEMMTGPFFGGVCEDRWFETAETLETGNTVKTMLAKAAELDTHIIFTFFEKATEYHRTVYYNSVGIASPTRGLIGVYHKTHIPWMDTPSVKDYEKYYFKPGSSLPVYKLDNGASVGILVCYDRSFPEAGKVLQLQRAQLICIPTCSWGFRHDFFVTELRTRAFETHAFVVDANRAGDEIVENEPASRHHFGTSIIIDPEGGVQKQLDDTPWSYICDEIDLDKIDGAYRNTPWLRDRRPELYGMLTASGANYGSDYKIIPNNPIK